MARRFQSDGGKKAARANAEKVFNGGSKKKAATKKEPRVLPDLLAGDNGPKARDFLHHYRTAKGLKAKAEEANGLYRNALKVAKEAGIDPKALTDTMRYEKRDPLEVQQFFKQLRSTFEAASIQVQLDIFNESAISRPAQIYDDGYKAAKAGKPESDSPHGADTEAGQTWLQGFYAGSLDNAKGIGKTPEAPPEADTAAH